MSNQKFAGELSVLLVSLSALLTGCQANAGAPTTRPTGSIPSGAANDQGNQPTPPVIHFNQGDHN